MRVEASVVIDRPRGVVWQYLTTPSNTPAYWKAELPPTQCGPRPRGMYNCGSPFSARNMHFCSASSLAIRPSVTKSVSRPGGRLARADVALYRAKSKGRDRVEVEAP